MIYFIPHLLTFQNIIALTFITSSVSSLSLWWSLRGMVEKMDKPKLLKMFENIRNRKGQPYTYLDIDKIKIYWKRIVEAW